MRTNMGTADRIMWFTIAAMIVILYTVGIISGTLGIILLVVAGIFVLTSSVRFCPLYKLFGFDTYSISQKSNN